MPANFGIECTSSSTSNQSSKASAQFPRPQNHLQPTPDVCSWGFKLQSHQTYSLEAAYKTSFQHKINTLRSCRWATLPLKNHSAQHCNICFLSKALTCLEGRERGTQGRKMGTNPLSVGLKSDPFISVSTTTLSDPFERFTTHHNRAQSQSAYLFHTATFLHIILKCGFAFKFWS